ncbi:hypothetical protein ACP3TJ_01915 [Desulforudis sp. 1088]|uniref:hypothetical protein n=1 Tax=unclassified Candidatus Desulforudis TaxID=2635950 RepID=UPI00348529C6
MKADNYRMPLTCFSRFKDPAKGDRRLVMRYHWLPGDQDAESRIQGSAIKITRLGIRQEDAAVDVNLGSPKKAAEDRDETRIMAAVNEYYDTFGTALIKGDITIFERKYGYLQPTGERDDGVNDWRRQFNVWMPLGVKDYSVSFNEPIVTVSRNTATADLDGLERILRNGGESAGGFGTVIHLEKSRGQWKITMVDEFTETEMYSEMEVN